MYCLDGAVIPNHWNASTATGATRTIPSNGYSGDSDYQPSQRRLVSGSQSFILGAVIHTTNKMLPYQNAMVENYLQVCNRNDILKNEDHTFGLCTFISSIFSFVIGGETAIWENTRNKRKVQTREDWGGWKTSERNIPEWRLCWLL